MLILLGTWEDGMSRQSFLIISKEIVKELKPLTLLILTKKL